MSRSSRRGRRGGRKTLGVTVARSRADAYYKITEETSHSLSEFSSLTDLSTSELFNVQVDLHTSVLKVDFKIFCIILFLIKRLFREYVEIRK